MVKKGIRTFRKKHGTVAGNLSSTHLHARSLSGLKIFLCSRQSRRKRALRIGPDGTKSCERASQTPSFARRNSLPMTYVTISLSSGSSHVQWNELRAYCKSKGIWLIGDVPLFVAHQSADVWAHPGLFKLDADGNPTVVAGVPPDYFSKTGQVWNVPVYRWEALQAAELPTGGSNACGRLLDGSMSIGWIISSALSAPMKCPRKPRRL